MININMIQVTTHNWRIESEKGAVIQADITAHSEYEAIEYVKRYISSFSGWSYRIVLLKNEDNR